MYWFQLIWYIVTPCVTVKLCMWKYKNGPELLSASVDKLLIESVETSALRFNLLKVLLHLFSPFSLMRAHSWTLKPVCVCIFKCAYVCVCVFRCTYRSSVFRLKRSNHTWDLKYVSCGVDSTSADAISRWRRIWRKEGLFRGLQFLRIQDGKDSCVHSQCTVKSIKSSLCHYSNLLIFCLSFLIPTVHFQASLTSTVWGGSWSRRGSSQVRAAVGCCFPHPRWWQMSPHLYKVSLQLASPTAPLRRTLKLSQAFIYSGSLIEVKISLTKKRNPSEE